MEIETEYIDVSVQQYEPIQEKTRFIFESKSGCWDKIPRNENLRLSYYDKVILLDYEDDMAVFVTYAGENKRTFLGFKGEEFC